MTVEWLTLGPGMTAEQAAANIRKHCEDMAREIAWRVKTESNGGLKSIDSKMVERHALGTLLDWFLAVPSERPPR
jgi:hypothetical protein